MIEQKGCKSEKDMNLDTWKMILFFLMILKFEG